jgi:hypothetical protein
MVFRKTKVISTELNMSAEKKTRQEGVKKDGAGGPDDVPRLFRINVEVGNLDEAAKFYGELFGFAGRKQAGSRCYFDCGAVTLQVVDVSSARPPHPAAKALYFVVNDLEAIHQRAESLRCLSQDEVHGSPGGKISVQPWGERSFCAEDRWRNPLCFVEAGTTYAG